MTTSTEGPGDDTGEDAPVSSRIDDKAADAIARAFGVLPDVAHPGPPPPPTPPPPPLPSDPPAANGRYLPAPVDHGRVHVAWERPRRTEEDAAAPPAGPPRAPDGAPTSDPGAPAAVPIRRRRGGGLAVALRSLLRQRRRLALSTIAVALGVGYLAGSLSLLHRVGNGLAAQSGRASETADYVVEGTVSLDTPLEYVRRLVPDSIVEPIRRIPGVAAVEPRLESTAIIIPTTGDAVVSLGLTERPLGANWPTDDGLNPYRLEPGGRPPVGEDEVVIDRRSATAAGVEVDDTVVIATKVTTLPFRVTGIVDLDDDELPEGSSLSLFSLDTARRLFDLNADDNAIAIRLEPGADAASTAQRIAAILPFGSELADGPTHAEHRQTALAKSFTLVRVLLIAFAVLAVVVGAFTVANSMALLFEHRRRGFALLRVVGATSGQLRGAAATEAAVAGAGAGVTGIVVGLGIGFGIEAALRSLGSPVPVAGSPITWWIPPLAVAVGVVTTVAAGLAPAHAAASAAPVEALGPRLTAPARRRNRIRIAVVLLAGGLGAAIGAVVGGAAAAAIGAGAGLATGAVLALLPTLLGAIVTAATGLLVAPSAGLRHVATARSDQARLRTSSTAAALMLAVTVVAGLGVLARSFVDSLDDTVEGAIRADLVVDSGTLTRGGLAGDLIPRLRTVPGVSGVSGWRTGTATVGGATFRIAGMEGESVFELLDLDLADEPPATLPSDGIALSESAANAAGLRTGDRTPVQFASGAVRDLQVVAIYRSSLSVLLGEAIVDSAVLAEELGQSVDILAFVGLEPGAAPSTVDQVREVSLNAGAKSVLRPEELVSRRVELLRGFGRVIQWMLLFSVVLALVGVANTLQLGVHERRRELGLLRAIGATRRQVVALVVAEATALSVVGTLAGTALGIGAAAAAVAALGDLGLSTLSIPVLTLVWVGLAALGLGLVGSAWPAVRAARTPVLDALGEHDDRPAVRARGSRSGAVTPRPPDAGRAVEPPPPSAPPTPTPPPPPSEPEPSRIVTHEPATTTTDPFVQPEDADADMTETCFNCGHDPGEGERCAVCGAARLAVPSALFSLGGDPTDPDPETDGGPTWVRDPEPEPEPEPVAARPEPEPEPEPDHTIDEVDQRRLDDPALGARPRPVSFSPDFDEITDAEIVEDSDPVTPAAEPPVPPDLFSSDTGPSTVPPPPFSAQPEPEPAEHPDVEEAQEPGPDEPPSLTAADPFAAEERSDAAPGASLFEVPPHPDFSPRSPFGQFANDDGVSDPARGKWTTHDPDEELIAQALAGSSGGFAHVPVTAPVPSAPASPPAPAGPPPAFASGRASGADDGPLVPPAPSAVVEPDGHGLAAAVGRVGASGQTQCAVAFSVAGALLGEDESVVGAVAGQSLGVPTAVVATTERVLVVSDRRWVPTVESFQLEGLDVLGRHAQGTASMTFSDPERLVTIDQIHDVALAIELVGTVRALGSGTEF